MTNAASIMMKGVHNVCASYSLLLSKTGFDEDGFIEVVFLAPGVPLYMPSRT
jgi:hypothetical protein